MSRNRSRRNTAGNKTRKQVILIVVLGLGLVIAVATMPGEEIDDFSTATLPQSPPKPNPPTVVMQTPAESSTIAPVDSTPPPFDPKWLSSIGQLNPLIHRPRTERTQVDKVEPSAPIRAAYGSAGSWMVLSD